ncbi:MAG: response regulator transcription factor [Deltaproteobacteria bacterium]|jgi:DNA-binding response OmpR family regulator|nr:response regulator transcription factor [Deltaproteobacteria bacterium]
MTQAIANKIMIVDDAARLRRRLEDFLKSHRFVTASWPDGRGAIAHVSEFKPDLVLLDVMMPVDDGFSVLKRLRSLSAVPIIMLTAANTKDDRVKGLDEGADDYIGKPFALTELLARINAVLRRAKPLDANPGQKSSLEAPDSLVTGPLTLDVGHHRLILTKPGQKAHKTLSLLEFRLFYLFMANVGEILSRDRILAHVYDEEIQPENHGLNVYVNRLRKVLAEIGADPQTLATVWGYGYSWRPAPSCGD